VSFLLTYILRDVSFVEGGSVYRVVFREPMNLLCTCVSEEGGDGEAVCSETPSLLSYTLDLDTSLSCFFFSLFFSFTKRRGHEYAAKQGILDRGTTNIMQRRHHYYHWTFGYTYRGARAVPCSLLFFACRCLLST
jgi:hypothetical protein